MVSKSYVWWSTKNYRELVLCLKKANYVGYLLSLRDHEELSASV